MFAGSVEPGATKRRGRSRAQTNEVARFVVERLPAWWEARRISHALTLYRPLPPAYVPDAG